MKGKAYAVDFDGTLCSDAYPGIGEPNRKLIAWLRSERARGAKVILHTSRCGERLAEAVDWCAAQGLAFDAVNENLPERVRAFGSDPRKISADIYIDDRAAAPWRPDGLPPAREGGSFMDGSGEALRQVIDLCRALKDRRSLHGGSYFDGWNDAMDAVERGCGQMLEEGMPGLPGKEQDGEV